MSRKEQKRRKAVKRKKLENYLQNLVQRKGSEEFEPTEHDLYILGKIEEVYDEFLEKITARKRPLTQRQEEVLETWSKLLDRDLPDSQLAA